LNSDEYIAICQNSDPVKVLIKLTFKNIVDLNKWGDVLVDLMDIKPK